MSTFEEAQSADPRALLSAAALGSVAGLVLGGVYLLSAHVTSPSAPAATISTAPIPGRTAAIAPVLSTRVPLRLLPFAAEPYHAAADAEAGRDRACLTQAVYYEARGEAAEGQQAVAQVVMNRVRHPAFPKSVCGVVFQRSAEGCQFSFACAGHPLVGHDVAAWRRADRVAAAALDGFVMRRVGRATNFHVSTLATEWSQGLARIAQIGAHAFYGFAPHSGAARIANERAEPALAVAPTPQTPLTLASLGGLGAERVHALFVPAKLDAPEVAKPAVPTSTSVATVSVTPTSTASRSALAPSTASGGPPPPMLGEGSDGGDHTQ